MTIKFVPYAEQIIVDDHLGSICPECGVVIIDATDSTGETTTNRYEDHFGQAHTAVVDALNANQTKDR